MCQECPRGRTALALRSGDRIRCAVSRRPGVGAVLGADAREQVSRCQERERSAATILPGGSLRSTLRDTWRERERRAEPSVGADLGLRFLVKTRGASTTHLTSASTTHLASASQTSQSRRNDDSDLGLGDKAHYVCAMRGMSLT